MTPIVSASGVYKARSDATHREVHLQFLHESPEIPLPIVLLGDSMWERFKTTGASTSINQGVPIIPNGKTFNAGVGGDKIQNVMYRVDLGLLRCLKKRDVRLFALHMGTNNLKPRAALGKADIEAYHLLVQAIVKACPDANILITGLFKHMNVKEGVVEKSNEELKRLVRLLNQQLTENDGEKGQESKEKTAQKVFWLDAPEVDLEEDMDDAVHLNTSGYEKWDAVLAPKFQELAMAAPVQQAESRVIA